GGGDPARHRRARARVGATEPGGRLPGAVPHALPRARRRALHRHDPAPDRAGAHRLTDTAGARFALTEAARLFHLAGLWDEEDRCRSLLSDLDAELLIP